MCAAIPVYCLLVICPNEENNYVPKSGCCRTSRRPCASSVPPIKARRSCFRLTPLGDYYGAASSPQATCQDIHLAALCSRTSTFLLQQGPGRYRISSFPLQLDAICHQRRGNYLCPLLLHGSHRMQKFTCLLHHLPTFRPPLLTPIGCRLACSRPQRSVSSAYRVLSGEIVGLRRPNILRTRVAVVGNIYCKYIT